MISNLAKKLFWIFMIVLVFLIFLAPTTYYEDETKDKNIIMITNKYSKICIVAEFDKEIKKDEESEKITYTMMSKTSGYAKEIIEEEKTYYLMEGVARYYVFEDKDIPTQDQELNLIDCIKLWLGNNSNYSFTIENSAVSD